MNSACRSRITMLARSSPAQASGQIWRYRAAPLTVNNLRGKSLRLDDKFVGGNVVVARALQFAE